MPTDCDTLSLIPETAFSDELIGIAGMGLSLLGAAPFIWKADGQLTWPHDELSSKLFRCQVKELPSRMDMFDTLLDQTDRNNRKEALANLAWNGAQYVLTYELTLLNGQRRWVEERGQRVRGEGKRPTKIIGVLTDIHARKQSERDALYTASFDKESGLWNRTRMREGVVQLAAVSDRYDQSAGLILFQLNNLDDVKKSYGIEAVRHLITEIAKRLEQELRRPDIVARLDTATFAIGLCRVGEHDLLNAAQRILTCLTAVPYPSPYGEIYADFSCGAARLGSSVDESFAQCRAALDVSVKTAQNVSLYAPDMERGKMGPMSKTVTAEDILLALNSRRIELAYQPIIDASTREVYHYECLMRRLTDDGNLVSAFDMITAAEHLDLVHLLDRRALELAAMTLQTNPDIHLALNISANTVKIRDYADNYLAALKAIGAATNRITIELTETVALEDTAQAGRFSDQVRAMGCKFAIDDFGSGYTSFRNLLAVEADAIKIDGAFIRDLSTTPHKQVFVRMMVDLAQTFSVKTVAEMVGSDEDAELLTQMGVDYLQGFIFGIPGAAPQPKRKAS